MGLTLLTNGVSTLFANGKPAVINGQRKLKNPPSWLVIFVVVPFNKIPLFSKDLINVITSFISLFVRVIPGPVLDFFTNYKSCYDFSDVKFANVIYLIGEKGESNILGGPNRNPPNCTILDK